MPNFYLTKFQKKQEFKKQKKIDISRYAFDMIFLLICLCHSMQIELESLTDPNSSMFLCKYFAQNLAPSIYQTRRRNISRIVSSLFTIDDLNLLNYSIKMFNYHVVMPG